MQVRRQRAQFNVLLTSYELLLGVADRPRLAQLRWGYIIVDEGQRLKNSKCKLNAAMRQYRSNCRLLITGGAPPRGKAARRRGFNTRGALPLAAFVCECRE